MAESGHRSRWRIQEHSKSPQHRALAFSAAAGLGKELPRSDLAAVVTVQAEPVYTLSRAKDMDVASVMAERKNLLVAIEKRNLEGACERNWHTIGRMGDKASLNAEKALKSKRKVIWDEVYRLSAEQRTGEAAATAELQQRFIGGNWAPVINKRQKILSEFILMLKEEGKERA